MFRHKKMTLLLASMLVLVISAAEAHTALFWYPVVWGSNRNNIRAYWASSSFADKPSRRARIQDGHEDWDALGQGTNVTYPGNDYTLVQNPCSNPANKNGIFWVNIPEQPGKNVLADVQRCTISGGEATGTIISYVMRFDNEESWYAGTGDVPLGSIDLWGVATHEAGHAFGFSPHWDEGGLADPSLCPGTTANHTMCATVVGRGRYLRSLETHDIHTFSAAY